MNEYKLTENGVYHYDTGAHIPNDEGNRDWREYLSYVQKGGDTDPLKTDVEIFEEEQEGKRQAVRNEFLLASSNPVEINGIFYEGGMDSSLAIDGATRIAERLGAETVFITDSSNVAKEYTLEEAYDIAAYIGLAYSNAFMEKQRKMVEIDKEVQP